MSTAEIIEELPKLTAEERKAVRQRLWELEAEQQELEKAAGAADLVFQELDLREAADADAR
jgi:hypothetical protein